MNLSPMQTRELLSHAEMPQVVLQTDFTHWKAPIHMYMLLLLHTFAVVPLYYTKKTFKVLPLLFRFNFKQTQLSPLLGSKTFCFLSLLLGLFFVIMLQNDSFPSYHLLDGFIFHFGHATLQEGMYKCLGFF